MDATGSRDAWNAKSHVSRSPRIWAVAAFVFVLALCIFPKGAHAQLTVPSFEGNISLPVVQLLYDGHWLPVRWVSDFCLPSLCEHSSPSWTRSPLDRVSLLANSSASSEA